MIFNKKEHPKKAPTYFNTKTHNLSKYNSQCYFKKGLAWLSSNILTARWFTFFYRLKGMKPVERVDLRLFDLGSLLGIAILRHNGHANIGLLARSCLGLG